MQRLVLIVALMVSVRPALAGVVRVPEDQPTIQSAIDALTDRGTVLVAPGRYCEHIRLKPGMTVRSVGDDSLGKIGLNRAEATILDLDNDGTSPGVTMAEGSTLDGITITRVGQYDDALWQKHYDSHGEELGDEEGSVQAEGTNPAIRISGVACTILHCVIHHNGDVGIGVLGKSASGGTLITANHVYRNLGGGIGVAEGAEPLIRENACWENLRAGIGCRQASPILIGNKSFRNIRAGIGCREGSRPVIRRNTCSQNRRAGIGIRMAGTAPIVEDNVCTENAMAGIGCRDEAAPVLRRNLCRSNQMAGIGCREGATPLIVENECRSNARAGIGLESGANATIHGNTCADNGLVAIGVTGKSKALISSNDLARTGGMPPVIAVRDGSHATIHDNRLTGGGVAAILVQGQAAVRGNTFQGVGAAQGNAVWVWKDSTASIADNTFNGYRTAVHATGATLEIFDNSIRNFGGTAILVHDSAVPAHVYGNTASSMNAQAKIVDVRGPSGVVERNVLNVE